MYVDVNVWIAIEGQVHLKQPGDSERLKKKIEYWIIIIVCSCIVVENCMEKNINKLFLETCCDVCRNKKQNSAAIIH